MHELTAFQRDVLFTIAGMTDEPYGIAIKDALSERWAEEIHHSRLYQNLDALDAEGYIECSAIDDRTNCYELTPDGREQLERFVEWQAVQLEAGE